MNKYDADTCCTCAHWGHANKRNCGNQDTPYFYAECLYPMDKKAFPSCVSVKEMGEAHGTRCPCFVKLMVEA